MIQALTTVVAIILVWQVLVLNTGCSKVDSEKASYGELPRYRHERVHLLLSAEVFAAYAPYSTMKAADRETLMFQSMEANLQLNLARIKHVLDTEELSRQTRSMLEQNVRDCSMLFARFPPVYRVWNVKGQVYDLGEKEPILPRYTKVYDILQGE